MKHGPVRLLLDIACSASADPKQRQDAIPDLALLLEKHSHLPDSEKNYRELLRPDLLDVYLDQADKTEIVAVLCRQLEKEPSKNGIIGQLLWALKKTDRAQSLHALQSVVRCLLHNQLDDGEIWQGLLSIEVLSYSVENTHLSQLMPDLEDLQARIVASGDTENRKAIENIFTRLSGRGL